MKKWLIPLIFAVVGGLIGYSYYALVGCSTGTCPITSNPWHTTVYFAVIGLLLSGMFAPRKKKE